MPHIVHRRVVSPVLAVRPETQCDRGFVTVPPGSIIELLDDLREPGLYRITLGTVELLAFARDIQERTEHLEERTEPIALSQSA